MVCLPKDEGGLGVINIKAQKESLLLKHLHKFYNREDIPWVKLVWECYYSDGRLPGNSNKVYFWHFAKKVNPMNSTTFVLFGKYCPIVDQLGSKDSSRDFQLNCVISYFFTYI